VAAADASLSSDVSLGDSALDSDVSLGDSAPDSDSLGDGGVDDAIDESSSAKGSSGSVTLSSTLCTFSAPSAGAVSDGAEFEGALSGAATGTTGGGRGRVSGKLALTRTPAGTPFAPVGTCKVVRRKPR